MTVRIKIENTNSTDDNECEILVLQNSHTVERKSLKPGEAFDTYVHRGQEVYVRDQR